MTSDDQPASASDGGATETDLIGAGARALANEPRQSRQESRRESRQESQQDKRAASAGALMILPRAGDYGGRAVSARLRLLLAASIAFGLALGLYSGLRTGARPTSEAGARQDAASFAKALPWKSEIATDADDRRKVARLLDELRSLRAQVEQIRHASENSRMVERIRALEASRNATLESARTREAAKIDASARLDKLEDRLNRLERASADKTPIGAIPKPDRAAAAKTQTKDQESEAKSDQAKSDLAKSDLAKSLRGRYVVREVVGGVAVLERRDGLIEEVAAGDDLPGAGRVMAIERRGRAWVVVTTRGVIDQRSF